MIVDQVLNHLDNRQSLTATTPAIGWSKPIETALPVVRSPLLGKEQCEPALVGECAPTQSVIDIMGRLAAPMQHNDKRRSCAQPRWNQFQHAKIARITPESIYFRKPLCL
jgi:hypothetical protein